MENKQVYRLQGLSCANCAAQFEKNVKMIDTVKDAQVNFGAAKLTVMGSATIEQLEQAGAFDRIKVIPEKEQKETPSVPFWRKRANLLAMISAFFLLFGYIASISVGEKSVVTIGLFAISILIGGYDLFKTGIAHFFRFQFDMKTLMTIAIIGAALIGEWQEGAVVIFLFAISEALERYSMDKARRSIHRLMEIAPKKAIVRRGGREYEVNVDDLQIGDTIVIKPGQKIAMDGIVIRGESSVNEAAITGESIPVYKTVGDEVYAGALNEEGALEVRVTKRVEDSTIAKIIHLVEEAQAERAPSQQFVDRFARYYTPAIMVIAFLVAVIPPLWLAGEWQRWIYRGLTVLVVGCPCALVISTPVAIVTAIGQAARQGVLIKGGIYLEEMGRLAAMAFDKTGTLTKGMPEVTDIRLFGSTSEKELLEMAAAIEKHSQHPLASAVLRKAQQQNLSLDRLHVTDFRSMTGKGAAACIHGTMYMIGKPSVFSDHLVPAEAHEEIQKLQQEGKTVILLGNEEKLLGLIAISDQVRSSAASVIKTLRKLGIEKTVMLTGDNAATAKAIGESLGLTDVKAELLPEEKLTVIKEIRNELNCVAMVGDGINDAPALAAATVGIAMGKAGTDVALETADVVLMADDLRQLPYAIRLSRKTLRIIKENITFALALKLFALLLIIPGWLTLWMAIFADMGATLLVLLNSLRLVRLQ
ncbi:heavy metal translocating P-type ATPase [Thermaerobacillus caldiproteolyticus]|uniref:heavy metal translocating P-type ATPase n=1 Tax=Thermaerobacillus caldiproteolyticus TaxID=247480 RepID=UPI00188CD61D|nr:heavy metal translocating P-type ATPase [Anoxybacillus caldiproteolyticus]QPA32642.1 cadmium-translocating P-type ATPase [Anoxybacillus caldiproteolyticus]